MANHSAILKGDLHSIPCLEEGGTWRLPKSPRFFHLHNNFFIAVTTKTRIFEAKTAIFKKKMPKSRICSVFCRICSLTECEIWVILQGLYTVGYKLRGESYALYPSTKRCRTDSVSRFFAHFQLQRQLHTLPTPRHTLNPPTS